MADVRWIKIVTDIFDDEKILLIESMPDADAVIVIWFKLLCLAGKTNNGGVLMINDKIAYTDEMLATIFRRPLNTVRMALNTFEDFGMIERVSGVVTIPNWSKHQSLDALEHKKEYMREYMANRRAEQKQLCETNSKTNSKTNVSRADIDKKRIDKDIDKENKGAKRRHGTYGKVLLTDDEEQKLVDEYGETETLKAIEYFDAYIAEKGYKSKSHYLAMRRWVFDAVNERKTATGGKKISPALNYPEVSQNELESILNAI